MPSSQLALWPAIVHLVWEVQPRTILDVGPGRAKGGVILAEYIGRTTGPPPNGPIERIDALEVEPSYVTPTLLAVYDNVILDDVRETVSGDFEDYDVVLLIDVIEHLKKEEGLALLRRIPGRVVVSTPVEFFHNGEGLPDSETHRSVWTREDFESVRTIEADASAMGGIVLRLAPLGS